MTPVSIVTGTNNSVVNRSSLIYGAHQNGDIRQSSYLKDRIQRARLDAFTDEVV